MKLYVHMVHFDLIEIDGYQVLHFRIDDILGPDDLRELTLPTTDRSAGIVLSGRGPIWLYGYLVHECHPHPFVAIYDPRLNGAVIVERHLMDVPCIGSVLSMPRAKEVLRD